MSTDVADFEAWLNNLWEPVESELSAGAWYVVNDYLTAVEMGLAEMQRIVPDSLAVLDGEELVVIYSCLPATHGPAAMSLTFEEDKPVRVVFYQGEAQDALGYSMQPEAVARTVKLYRETENADDLPKVLEAHLAT